MKLIKYVILVILILIGLDTVLGNNKTKSK